MKKALFLLIIVQMIMMMAMVGHMHELEIQLDEATTVPLPAASSMPTSCT